MKKFISALSSLCLAATTLFTALPAAVQPAEAAEIKAGAIQYDLVPATGEYELKDGYNVVKVEKGATITVNWIVNNDAEAVGGMEYTLDVSKVASVANAKVGKAYSAEPLVNTDNAGEIVYTFSTMESLQAKDGAVIMKMDVTVPDNEGTYAIGLKTGGEYRAMTAGHDKGVSYDYTFHGIKFQVGDTVETTTTTTSSSQKIDPADGIVYDLIPAEGAYELKNGNNVVKVAKGATVTVNWIVNNDAEAVGGMEYTLDVSKVASVANTKVGKAYSAEPLINTDNAGEIVYTFSTMESLHAKDGAVIMKMDVTVPDKDGSYTIGLKTGGEYRAMTAGHDKGVSYDYTFHGITFEVGDVEETTTSSTATTTSSSKIDPEDGIIYDLIPAEGAYELKNGNNVVKVAKGATVTVNWIVNNDAEAVGGMEYTLDVSKVASVANAKVGKAYSAEPLINTDNAGEIVYTFSTMESLHAKDGAVIMKMDVTVPDEEGSYTIGLKTGGEYRAMTAGHDKGVSYDYTFHGITFEVGDVEETTTSSTATTTSSSKIDPSNGIVYDLVPAEGEYELKNGNNVVKVAKGATVTVNWIVNNDAEAVGGMEYTLDISKVASVANAKVGKAYSAEPLINTDNAGEIVYTFSTMESLHAKDGAVIMKMDVTVPDEEGSYTIGLKTGGEYRAMTAGHDKGVSYDYVFHGITFEVGDVETTTGTTTSSSTTTTTTTVVFEPAGSAEWVIDTKTVAAGAEVALPVMVNADDGTAGFVFKFTYDDALTFNGYTWGDQYTAADDTMLNKDKTAVVWANKNGADEKAKGDILYLNFTAPSAKGEYPVKFESLEVVNFEQQPLTVKTTDGAVIVDEVTPAGKADWLIERMTVPAGSEVALPVNVYHDEGTAGFVVKFSYDDALTFNGYTWGNQYTAADDTMLNKGEMVVVWASPNGEDEKADGSVLYLNFTAPDAKGEYPVKFESLEVINFDQQPLELTKEDGAVIVDDLQPAGKSNWKIDTQTVAAGSEVALPVFVTEDEGTAGFVVKFTYDDKLVFNGYTWGDQYTAADDTMLNKEQMIVVWASANGEDEKADGKVLYLNFTAPDEAGEYPVKFDSLEVINFDQQPLELTKEDGAVIVELTTTTESTTTSTDTTTTESTTTESTTTDSTTTESTTTQSTTTESTTTQSTTTQSTTTQSTTTESTTTQSTTTESTTTQSTTTESTTTQSTTTESTTTQSTTTESTTTQSTTTESTTTQSTTTDSTTTESTTTDSTTTESTTTGSTTTESTTSTTITTETNPNPGNAIWDIDDVIGRAGTTVKVPVYALSDEGVAGFRVQFEIPEGFKITGMTWGDAYGNADQAMFNKEENLLIWDDPNGNSQVAAPGSVIAILDVLVPEGAAVGTKYPINFITESIDAHNGNDQPVKITGLNGSITIAKNDTIAFEVEDTTGAPGSKVDIPLDIVLDPGTGSFEITLDIPDALNINDITFDPEYEANGTFTWDPDTKTLTWTKKDGSDFTPDKRHNIATINVTVPEDAAPGTTFDIDAKTVKATATNGDPLDYIFNGGKLTVTNPPETTTTTSTTTTTTTISTTTDTTTTESTTTESTTTDSTTTESTTTQSTTTDSTTTESTTTDSTTTESTTTQSTTTESTTTQSTTTESTTTQSTTTESTTTQSTTTESTTTNSTTTESTTTNSTTTESTTTNSTTTESTTTNSTTTESTTTGTTTGTTKVVTTYEIVFEPPTRVNYWSHDDRTFKTSGGLKDMVAKIVVSKYYTDENGNVAKLPFEEKELEVTAYTNPDESEDSPMEIWNNEISAALGKTDWTYEEAQGVKHANKYRLDAYYTYSADINDPDFDINNGEPLKLGDFPIYIGVKGDYNLDNYVDAKDAQLTLKYYVDKLALKTPSLNADPELDGEDGLVFFLIDVCYRDGKTADSPLANPKSVDARDAQTILKYYVDALALKQKTWTDEVGYDYLDYFYGDVIQ